MRLNLDRDGQVRIACDPDLLAYWLRPRLGGFFAQYPGIRLAFLVDGDPAPADLSLLEGGPDEVHLPDWMIPVVSIENLERIGRIAGPFPVEGMPLLHVDRPARAGAEVGWPDWVARFPLRQTAADRGFRYRRWSDARNFARAGVGLALVPLSLVADALTRREIFHLFPTLPLIPARLGWRVTLHRTARPRPNVMLFHDWLKDEAAKYLAALPPALANGELAMETLAPPR
jgi:LysR family glycine cleavage system transcriptional activator